MDSSDATVKQVRHRILEADKLKNCFECGICTASCSMAEMLGNEYGPRKLLEEIYSNPEEALTSEALWVCAWCYRCHSRCPQGLKLPEIFLSLRKIAVARGQTRAFDKALRRIVKNIPLPLVATFVCYHPERAGLKNEQVIKRIGQLREEFVNMRKNKTGKASKVKIAIVGSGPAGLAAAYELIKKDYGVTVFEALSQAGGMLRKGIPQYRLPKKLVTEEIEFIKAFGVEVKTETEIGKSLSFEDLKRMGYRAFFVGTGAHKSHKLNVEGADLKGVVDALDFLCDANLGKKIEVGSKVTVVGGGNVAVDAARTTYHLGASEVTILYRRSKDEMPANVREVEEAEHEGVKIEFLVSPKKILGKNGNVYGIECTRMRLDEPDETGRKKAIPIEGSEFTREADNVILAIGETPDLDFLPKDVELNEDGTLWVNPLTMETTASSVFGGGDAVTGPASVIEAIRDGKRAAVSIENYLKTKKED
ncbi:MAG TPA: FAD-dependent oxidoreductase [Patescibacteria group bacterium]|nr:FAD-dependent oxidoreductase [Patescibacteria group bacterium]